MANSRNAEGLYGIQMLRGVAAVAVALAHTLLFSNKSVGAFSPKWFSDAGGVGVDLFFVISGFIMFYVSFRPGQPMPAPGSFIARRLLRIFPLYWICCLGILAFMVAGYLKTNPLMPGNLLTSALLVPDTHKILGVSWTLSYELYFYLIFAAALPLRSATRAAIAITGAIATIMLVANALPPGILRDFLANAIALEFCFGLWLGWAFTQARRWRVPPALAAGAIPLIIVPLLLGYDMVSITAGFWRTLFWGPAAVLLIAAALPMAKPSQAAGRFGLLLGDASYAIYLTHMFVAYTYSHMLKVPTVGAIPQMWLVPPVMGAILAVGIATHLFVEKPIARMARRFGGRRYMMRLQRA